MSEKKEVLVRIHVVNKPKGIVRPTRLVRFFDTPESLQQTIEQVDPNSTDDDVCLFNVNNIESIEVFYSNYSPRFGKKPPRDE